MKFTWKDKEWYIDGYLAHALETLVYNVKKDWDFVIIISGDRMVRVGKSVLAQAVCGYLAYLLDRMNLNHDAYNLKSLFFDNVKMMDAAFKLPKYSVLHYDEGREGLAASKTMKSFQQDLLDFFAECGQLNHIFVVVAPDYFELKEEIAVARSEFLLNVFRTEENVERDIFNDGVKRPVVVFSRGRATLYNRQTKEFLYDRFKTTRRKNYKGMKHTLNINFTHQYFLEEEEYRGAKKNALSRFKERKEEEKAFTPKKTDVFRDRIILDLYAKKMIPEEISRYLSSHYDYEITSSYLYRLLKKLKSTEDD